MKSVIGHRLPSYCVLFDRSDRRIITGGDDGIVKIWCSRTGLLLYSLRAHSNCISDMSLDPSNTVLAVGSMDGYVSFWDLLLGHHLFTLNAYSPVLTLEFRPQELASRELVLMATCTDGYAKFWAINIQQRTWGATPVKYHCKSLARDEIRCASFSPAGLRFITGATDGVVRLISVPEAALIKSAAAPPLCMPYMLYLEDHEGYVNSVHWSSCGTRFVTSAWDGCVREWTCGATGGGGEGGGQSWRSEAFSTSAVLGASQDDVVPGRPRKVTIVSYCSGDQSILCAVNQSFELILFDRARRRPARIMRYHEADVFILTSNPVDDRIVLSAGCDGKAAIWFAPTGERLFDFCLKNTRFLDGGFSQDGSKFALVDDMGRLSLFGHGTSPEAFAAAPASQFFPTDWNELLFDSQRSVVDAITQRPPHLAPRDVVVSIERAVWEGLTLNPDYALEIPLEMDESLALRQRQLFTRQLRNEARLFRDELTSTPAGALPKHSRSRRRRLLYGSDVEEEDGIMAIPPGTGPFPPAGGSAAPGEGGESADEDFQLPSGGGSETDADLSVNSSEGEEEGTPSGPYNLRQRTQAPSPRALLARRREHRRLAEAELNDDDQLYRPSSLVRPVSRRRPLIEASSSSSEGEDAEDHFFTTAARGRGTGQASNSGTPRQRRTPAVPQAPSSWLAGRERRIFPYLPQIYDVVAYLPEGHKMFLRRERRPHFNDNLPWEVEPELDSDVVFGQISTLTFFPGEPTWCLVELTLLGRHEVREGLPPLTSTSATARKIQVSFYDMNNQPDFIIPYCRYAWSVQRSQRYRPGEVVRVVFSQDEVYEARIKRLKVSPERIPNRPWQCYLVEWLSLEDEPESLSPWELETILEEDAPERRPYECQEAIDGDVAHLIDEGLQRLLHEARAASFKKPVDLRTFPDYLETVAYPMDIGTIRQRLLRGYYRRVEALEWEARLIHENAYAYNVPNSDIVRDAEYVTGEILRLVKRAQRGTRRLAVSRGEPTTPPPRPRTISEREERARRRASLQLHQQYESPQSAETTTTTDSPARGSLRSLRGRSNASLQLVEALATSSPVRDSPRGRRSRTYNGQSDRHDHALPTMDDEEQDAENQDAENQDDDFQTPRRHRRARLMRPRGSTSPSPPPQHSRRVTRSTSSATRRFC